MPRIAKKEVELAPSKINRSGRPKRVPIHGLRDKLVVHGQEPGWHYCLVNEDKCPLYESAGYEFVSHEVQIGDRQIDVAQEVGGKVSLKVGNNLTGYLMRCTEEDYEEEMRLVDEETNSKESALFQSLNSKEDGKYGEVRVESSKPLAR
jgi:hypothetical protein